MRSLMSKLKRRRTTSLSEDSQPGLFKLQHVPDHKKRTYKRAATSCPESYLNPLEATLMQEEQQKDDEYDDYKTLGEAVLLLREPPSFLLTTPDGMDITASTPSCLMDSDDDSDDDEWDTDDEDDDMPPPLLYEPPRTPTKQKRVPPPLPRRRPVGAERPAPLALNTFVLGPPDEQASFSASDGDGVLFISPSADPRKAAAEEPISWWSWSSSSGSDSDSDSSSSSSSSSDSDSDEEGESATMYYPYRPLSQTGASTKSDDGLVSFPPLLSPEMRSFLDELDPEDVRDAEELLLGDEDGGYYGEDRLTRAVESAESEWASALTRPVPRWLGLRASNSFPVFRKAEGPGDLRHGGSKLRMAESVAS